MLPRNWEQTLQMLEDNLLDYEDLTPEEQEQADEHYRRLRYARNRYSNTSRMW